jgi:lysophospholipase L1-like esterase
MASAMRSGLSMASNIVPGEAMINRAFALALLIVGALATAATAGPFGFGPFGSGTFDAPSPAPRTALPLLGVIGDSRAYQGSFITSAGGVTTWRKRPMAFPVWVELASGGKLVLASELNKAVGGSTTSDLARQLDMLLQEQDKPQFVAILSGTNDFTAGGRAEVAWANYAVVLATMRAAGITPICLLDLPRDAASWTPQQAARSNAFNHIMRSEGPALGCIVVNANADLSDADGNPQAGFMFDGVHTTPAAASLIGRDIWAAISGKPAFWAPTPSVYSAADLFDAADNPAGNLLANSLFLNSGGANAGAGAAGTVAAEWTSEVTAGTGTVVASLVSRTGDPGQCQRLAIANAGAVEFTGRLKRVVEFTAGGSVWFGEDLVVTGAAGLIDLQPAIEDYDGAVSGNAGIALEPPVSGPTAYPFPADFAGRVRTDDVPVSLGKILVYTAWGIAPGGSAIIDVCAAELRRH